MKRKAPCMCAHRGPWHQGCGAKGPLPEEWHSGERAPRLATIAKWINANTTLRAGTKSAVYNTDTKVAGTRFRRQGRGRKGTILVIATNEGAVQHALLSQFHQDGVILRHNSGETYRHNGEVVAKLHDYLESVVPSVLLEKT